MKHASNWGFYIGGKFGIVQISSYTTVARRERAGWTAKMSLQSFDVETSWNV
jgi:hypothetical protein